MEVNTTSQFCANELAEIEEFFAGYAKKVECSVEEAKRIAIKAVDKKHGWTLLYDAACEGDATFVKYLIFLGADIDAKDYMEMTPLHWVSLGEDVAMADLLVSNGANVHAEDMHGNTPLHLAMGESNDADLIKILVSAGANIHEKNYTGCTPLCYAASSGNIEAAKYLISLGADIDAKGQ